MAKQFDVLGVGNAIVDVIARVDEDFLQNHDMNKGAMQLIDVNQAIKLYTEISDSTEQSGGSAANTIAGIASLGGKGAFIGTVADDDLGRSFANNLNSIGVSYQVQLVKAAEPTARCLIMVTPDGERTMNTYLGACQKLGPEHIDEEQVSQSKIVYLEGYLFDPPEAKKAFYHAAKMAHANGGKVSLTLSDAFCVDRYRDEFLSLVKNEVDILFANEAEICSLYQVDDFETAADKAGADSQTAVLTRSEKGSVVIHDGSRTNVATEPVDRVVDATGAGDIFAAGFLHGYCQNKSMEQCAQLGNLCARTIISQIGARPSESLKSLAKSKGLL